MRPRLSHNLSLRELQSAAGYQRRLLAAAVALLAPGGRLVYSTCSVSPLENESNVRWALDQHACLRLVPAVRA